MILRKVTLSNWRALEKFEMPLEEGLNVLQGRNEAGKSSVVESIDWALYRDITGARLKAEEVRVLIPASDPTARPSVEVELEFPDCRASLLKILSEDSAKRECRLTIRRDGHADEHFDRTEAQKRLKALFAADGMGQERGSVAGGGLLVAHQGESADFLFDGSAAIRSTLGVGTDGQLALTARLERARAAVENLRRKEMVQDLEPLAIEAARAGTDAARARETLSEAQNQKLHFEQVTREIEDLRGQIDELEAQASEVRPREAAAQQRVEELGALQVAQGEADKAVLNAQSVEREAKTALDGAKNRADDIARLRRLQEEAGRELEGSQVAVETAQVALTAAQQECDAALKTQTDTSNEAEEARHRADAWRHFWAVYEAHKARHDEKKHLEYLESLGADLTEKQKVRDAADKTPTFEEIRAWRVAFDRLTALENEAAQSIQLDIRALKELEIGWKADGAALEKKTLGDGESVAFGALAEGMLKIAGVGALRIRTGARGVEELKAEVETARTALGELLGKWEIEATQLPGAFELWEGKRTEFEAIEKEWKDAAELLKREESRLGSLYSAKTRVEERDAEFKAAKEAFLPFEGVIEKGEMNRALVKQAFDAADAEARELSGRASKARNEAATAAQKLRTAETEFHDKSARPNALRSAIAGRAEELQRLEHDGLTPPEREAHLEALNQTLAKARIELNGAQSLRQEMGDGVSRWKLDEIRREAIVLAEVRDGLDKTLVAKRRDLHHFCEQDATAEVERLEAVIETAQVEVSRHEARLRGVALLDAAIQAERARLSRDLAGPLNDKLGPWLGSLRGRETKLSFDEAGSKIENVLTKSGDSTIALPFAEHSEGLKEQVAFALRLLLATRVASHLPSKRLPVVLDDPFTQSDASRRGGLGEVLKDAAQSLQVLFVTCHSAPVVEGMPINLVRLGDWDEEAPPKPKAKAAKKVEKAEKVVLETNGVGEGTLALF